MLKFYLEFWNENRDALLDGKLVPENPEAGYSMVIAKTNTDIIATGYTKKLTGFIRRLLKNCVC